MKIENPQAFPRQDSYIAEGGMFVHPYQEQGMTLLDYFAAKAMQGLVVNQGNNNFHIRQPEMIANDCYKLAKAMLIEREKVINEVNYES